MKLSEFFSSGIMLGKEAELLVDLELSNGESRKSGDVVSILKDYGDGHYHAEDNEFACKVHESEIKFIN